MKLFVYCAGGFGREIVDLANRINGTRRRWDEVCFIDDFATDRTRYGIRLFSLEQILQEFGSLPFEVTIANGEPFDREAIRKRLKERNLKLASLIDDSAVVSETAVLGEGVTIPAFSFVSSSAMIGDNVTLNTNSLIGHDVTISENCVISSAVNIAGKCTLGRNTYVGMGSQIKQGVNIGSNVIIGMGSVVHDDVPDDVIAIGNPARVVLRNEKRRVFS